ncbi:hypothetical protein ACE7GA_05640 [Roseomonas sp. CCTCC AB2023176]|uniref:hypothetical protein n=1 Tax=Roseomonas sp. CCTCC AB2023176 TaxID=3342640 RepID=UPI0035DC0E02
MSGRASPIHPRRLFGFDVRRPLAPRPALFPRGPLAHDGPLATFDKYVNPSVFLHREVWERRGSPPTDRVIVNPSANVGFSLFLVWDDVMDMMAHYPGTEAWQDAALAYAWVDTRPSGRDLPREEMLEVLFETTTRPPEVPAIWPLLGFDVATGGYISFLSGFDHRGMPPDEIAWFADRMDRRTGLLAPSCEADLAQAVSRADRLAGEDPFFAIAVHLVWDHSDALHPAEAGEQTLRRA